MSTQTRYIRKGRLMRVSADFDQAIDISELPDRGESYSFDSVNKAKAFSHKLQKANGGLGRGFVRVER